YKEFYLYLNTDTYLSDLPIFLTDGEQTIQSISVRLNCLPQTDLLFGIVASVPSAFTLLNDLDPENGSASVAHIDPKALPDRAQGFEALDVLFFSDVDTGVLTFEQREALAGWLANGGLLVVSGGLGWQKTAAGLASFLPVEPESSQDLSSLDSLSSFSRSQQPLPEPAQAIPVASGTLLTGAMVLVEQNDVPIVIQRQYGLGEVYYLAFDPSAEPIKNWGGMIAFYQAMLAFRADQPGWASGFTNWQMAQEAASSLPGIALPSAILVCGFLSIYVVMVGPVNYLALRYLKRRELTWITIPVLVTVFSIFTLAIGGISRGRIPLVNQLSIVQVWPDVDRARVDGLIGIYSPRRTTYQVEIAQPSLSRPIITYDIAGQDLTFVQNTQNLTIPDLRVDIGGLETFATSGAVAAYPIDNQLKLIIDQAGVILQGRVVNQGDQTLADAVLLYPGGAQSLADFAPGSSYEINVPLILSQPSGKPQSTSYAPVTSPFSPATTYSYYGYGYFVDKTLQDILGTASYYENQENYQRFTLLNSALSDNYATRGRGGGVYLCGWVEDPSLDIQLTDRPARHNSSTVYLIQLDPDIEANGETLKLTPGIFVWESMPDSASSRSYPYNGSVYTSETQHLRFRLGTPIPYTTVEQLILHLESSYLGQPVTGQPVTDLTMSLWDFESSQWVQLEDISWGDNQIPQPARFVGPAGLIQLSITNTGTSLTEITQSDFTLIVER
ncbi:MAG: hypothetical protein JW726_05800, partial [Anaerolineales bacterium]|nr:hypothetical protein [Anaerolineales bacterium]